MLMAICRNYLFFKTPNDAIRKTRHTYILILIHGTQLEQVDIDYISFKSQMVASLHSSLTVAKCLHFRSVSHGQRVIFDDTNFMPAGRPS